MEPAAEPFLAPEGQAGDRDVTDDALYGGRIHLRQPRRGHRAGTDAVLLAAAVGALEGDSIYDLGAGTGAVGLMMGARYPGARIVLVERDPALIGLCRQNIDLNGWEERASAVEADLLAPASARRAAGLQPASADIVLTNPPFQDARSGRPSPDAGRAAAHVLPADGLSRWIKACADLLKPKGRLALIHRADRLDECLLQLARAFGGLRIRAVHARAGDEAIRVIVAAVKGSRAPLALLPPLILHADEGGFTAEAAALHRGEGRLM